MNKREVYCVCCERPLESKGWPRHHEGRERKEVPMCANCHWALHYGNLEVRKQMKGKIHAWLKKQETELQNSSARRQRQEANKSH